MTRIIGWFVSNPVAANLLMMILIVGGLISIFQLRQEEMPPIQLDMVSVSVPYLGAAPEEVENGVNLRIEEAMEGIQGIYRMTSIAREGNGSVLLELETDANRIQTANEIKSQIDAISTFPVETERPVVSLLTTLNDGLEIVISGDADERTLKELGLEMREEIAAIEGISNVELAYVRPDEVSIEVSERTLRRMGLTFDQVANAVRRTSLDMPGGSIKSGAGEILLRTQGQAYTGDDFREIVVLSREDGTRVYLDEVATIIDGFSEGGTQSRFDGNPAAIVRVNQVGDEDVVEISENVRAYVEEARGRMPDGIDLTIWRDESEALQARIDILLGSAATGLALVLLLLTLPLQFRLAMWVAAGIPIAMLGSFAMFSPLGITISTLSVFAFILVLGIVVDDAIVVGSASTPTSSRARIRSPRRFTAPRKWRFRSFSACSQPWRPSLRSCLEPGISGNCLRSSVTWSSFVSSSASSSLNSSFRLTSRTASGPPRRTRSTPFMLCGDGCSNASAMLSSALPRTRSDRRWIAPSSFGTPRSRSASA